MRSTKLYIIISVVVLIIVGIIATILSNQLKKGSDTTNNKQSAEKIESSGTRTLSRTEKYKEAGRITKQSNASLLSDEQVKKLDALCTKIRKEQNGVLSNEDFDMGCSNITNHIYVQKKTDNADTQLEAFLKENNALDILQTDLSLFVKTDQPLTKYMKDQENFLIEQLDEEPQPEEKAQSYEEIKKQNLENNLAVLKKLGNSLFSPSSGGVDKLNSLLFETQSESSSETSLLTSNESGTQGIVNPPNIENPNTLGYYKMPTATNGEYLFGGWNTCESHRYGSKTLISAIYTAALNWKAKYPQYTFRIGDLNGASGAKYPGKGHSSHGNGVDVDIVTYGSWSIQIAAPTQVNIDLGKAFIDTGVIKLIIFGGEKFNANAPIVQNAWKVYANSKGLPFQTYSYGNHDNHFHIRINDQYRLAEYRPAPCP